AALPESRELDLLARMLEERGAETVRCPLVSIHDNPDQGPVRAWVERLTGGEMDHLVLFTGEGLRRLLPVAEAMGNRQAMVEALERTPVTARGPKPARELRQLGLKPDHSPDEATTDGLIETLSALDLAGQRVGVQLYGTELNEPFMAFLRKAGAVPDPVAPYVYASRCGNRGGACPA
ncbi:MAG: uroporphyrinogen-III synthase, partial [Thiohalorhabdaceae bacterium]